MSEAQQLPLDELIPRELSKDAKLLDTVEKLAQ